MMRHRALAAWPIAFALFLAVLVPAGFMPVASGNTIRIELCSGFGPEKMAVPMPGMHHRAGKHGHSGKDPMPCGFSGTSAPSMTIMEPVLLVAAIFFVAATLFRMSIGNVIGSPKFLRPPLRGPPVLS